MKKIVAFILLMSMVLTLAACGEVKITLQEIYDAAQTESMLKNRESVYIRGEIEGEVWTETYLTKDYDYEHYPDEEFEYAQYTTNDVRYAYHGGDYLLYLFITPDGVGDFASDRAETYTSIVVDEGILDQMLESVSKKDGRITVTSVLSSKTLETLVEDGVTAGKYEYVLDAKTRELVSVIEDYTYEEGTTVRVVTDIAYDAEEPEKIDEFRKYESQAEDLRTVTIVSNPGTEKEVSQDFRTPRGLIIGFTWADEFEDKVELYADAACTEAYDPYADTDSDLTVYVKWKA